MGIAVGSRYKRDGQVQEETEFLNVTCWKGTAEYIGQHATKGRPVLVEGKLKSEEWEDKNTGQRRTRIKVNAVRVQLLDWDEENAGSSTAGTGDQSGGYEKEEDLAF